MDRQNTETALSPARIKILPPSVPHIVRSQMQHLARFRARGVLKVIYSCNKEQHSSGDKQHITNNEVLKYIIKPVYFNLPLNKASFYYLTQKLTCFANLAVLAALVCIHEQL